MKLAIIGSRSFTDYAFLEDTLLDSIVQINTGDVIVSGGVKGTDKLAEQFAYEYGLELEVFEAQWDKHDKSAGVLRNSTIVENSDIIFAFWDLSSKGTLDIIRKSLKVGKRIIVVPIERKIGITNA